MYSDDVKDLRRQKVVYDLKMLKDFLLIWGKLYFMMPDEEEARLKFKKVIKDWYLYSKNEMEVLNYILKEYGEIEEDDDVDDVLDILDEIFENMFDYYDDILDGYENMLELKQSYRWHFNEPTFETLSEEKKQSLIKKMSNN